MQNVKVEIVTGTNKKDKTKTWKALKVTIGEWSQLIFTKSTFEMSYIEKELSQE